MSEKKGNHDEALISFWTLRKAVGTIGIMLPIALIVGKIAVHSICPECGTFRGEYSDDIIQSSISSYYWTVVGDVLVAGLVAIGVFMYSYTGPRRVDNIPGYIACFSALGVAFFPTSIGETTTVGVLHYTSAAILFATLAYFCLVVFQRPDIGGSDDRKDTRNIVYRTCGMIIIACIALILVAQLAIYMKWINKGFWVFALEAIAIWAFGWSWFVKGKGFNLLRKT